jgi:hypothetical protein
MSVMELHGGQSDEGLSHAQHRQLGVVFQQSAFVRVCWLPGWHWQLHALLVVPTSTGVTSQATHAAVLWFPAAAAAAAAADRTKEFQFESVTFFVDDNLQRYLQGQDLLNVCDKAAGY